jgi:hypothetical protein
MRGVARSFGVVRGCARCVCVRYWYAIWACGTDERAVRAPLKASAVLGGARAPGVCSSSWCLVRCALCGQIRWLLLRACLMGYARCAARVAHALLECVRALRLR